MNKSFFREDKLDPCHVYDLSKANLEKTDFETAWNGRGDLEKNTCPGNYEYDRSKGVDSIVYEVRKVQMSYLYNSNFNPLRPNVFEAFLTTSRNSITTMLKQGLKTIYV